MLFETFRDDTNLKLDLLNSVYKLLTTKQKTTHGLPVASTIVDYFELFERGHSTITNFLLTELYKFEECFTAFLNQQLKKTAQYSKDTAELLAKISPDIESLETSILSFNYTSPFATNHNLSTINVHGRLNDKNIIFGIDSTVLSTKYVRENINIFNRIQPFTKTYRKLYLSDSTTWKLPKTPRDIIFYGHSLSSADYSYFQSIFDYVDIYNSEVSLCFTGSLFNDSQLKSDRMKNEVDIVHALITRYGNSFLDGSKGENLLHKLLVENRLHIRILD